jgi:hypothetical protein
MAGYGGSGQAAFKRARGIAAVPHTTIFREVAQPHYLTPRAAVLGLLGIIDVDLQFGRKKLRKARTDRSAGLVVGDGSLPLS